MGEIAVFPQRAIGDPQSVHYAVPERYPNRAAIFVCWCRRFAGRVL
ncbi:MAG TPA: hypothetical protein VKZ57_02415 [Sphingobacterium sp.]|nr:hypothetical protein [Sphingobacterium sp.]